MKLQYKKFGASTRFQTFHTSLNSRDYTELSQFRVTYKSRNLEVEVGHLFPTLGRGILLRTYEIPGSVWEDLAFRERYAFYRDLRGASVSASSGNFKFKVLHGEMLNVALPPSLDAIDRRPDQVSAGQLEYGLKKHHLGSMVLHRESQTPTGPDKSDAFLGGFYEGFFFSKMSVYAEYSRQVIRPDDSQIQEDDPGEAIYLGSNYTLGKLGISAEYKKYSNMQIGSGISDPPTLVKEHSSRLLNRSTHVPGVNNESGYQLDLFYSLESSAVLTFNFSRAKNEIREGFNPVWQEYFLEYQSPVGKDWNFKIYGDYAIDPRKLEDRRYAAGFLTELIHGELSSTFEMEAQQIERLDEGFWNFYTAYSIQSGSKFGLTAVLEYSADPFILPADKRHILYPSINGSFRPNAKSAFNLFIGKRRGGPSCNSGVCYEVLDFKGVEVRMTTRF